MGRTVSGRSSTASTRHPQQADLLCRTFGCVRLVWNKALAERTRRYKDEGASTSNVDTAHWLTAWKKDPELEFLREVSNVPDAAGATAAAGGLHNLFAKRARYPRFKSRHKSRASAAFANNAFAFRNGRLTLAKMSEPLNIVWTRPLPEDAEPSMVTVSRDAAGRWHVSILCQDQITPLEPAESAVGIDAGLEQLVALSTGEKVANPRHGRADRRRLAKAQQALSRKAKGSANRAKASVRVARAHARITDRRRDHLHKLTTRLVRENQTLCIEDLNVTGMLGNRCLARAISDAAWSALRDMLTYKCQWYGRDLGRHRPVVPVLETVLHPWLQLRPHCGAAEPTVVDLPQLRDRPRPRRQRCQERPRRRAGGEI
jgi:putative transposase